MSSSPDSRRRVALRGRQPARWLARSTAACVLALVLGQAQGQPAETVRPEVGKPLLAAQDLVKAQRFKEALARLGEADAVGGKSAYESFMVERMRIAAASGAGDVATMARAYEAMSGLNRLTASDKAKMLESIAGGYYRARDYAAAVQWAQRYFREGGSSPTMRTLMIQSQYLGGDFAGAARELTAEVQGAERRGEVPAEERLKLLLSAASKINDSSAYVYALERLVTHHPRPEYWADLLGRLQRKPGFSDRLAIDVLRLALATGSMQSSDEYMELAQLALQAGLPSQASQVLDQGFAAQVLGTGAQAERHQRLRELARKRLEESERGAAEREREALAARDGNALVTYGLNLVYAGKAGRGARLIQQGINQGGLKRPADARLHLGIAQLAAGDAAKALETFRSVSGADGSAELARLWMLHARRKG